MTQRSGTGLIPVGFVLILLLGAFFVVPTGTVSAEQDGDFTYTTSGSPTVATVTGYTGGGGAISIPSTLGGFPTVAIGEYAFSYDASLTSVSIPIGVTMIGNSAFIECASLTSVEIPSSVVSIGDYAFDHCTALLSVILPASVTSIGECAFFSCHSLSSVSIPEGLISIGNMAFAACISLTTIDVDSDNPNFTSASGVLFDKSMSLLIQCPGGKEGAFTVPSTVTLIGDQAFGSCISLTSVTIPNSVMYVGAGAFYACTHMTYLSMGSGVISLGLEAFDYCTLLTSVTLPASVTTIGQRAFYTCESLTSISFVGLTAPTSVGMDWITYTHEGICGHAYASSNFPTPGGDFYGLIMGDVMPIDPWVLEDYTYSISDGKATVTGYIGPGGSIVIPSAFEGYPTVTIGDSAFSQCHDLADVVIPASVTSIGSAAFADCTSLASIVIPEGVTSIGDAAFYSCLQLVSVTIPAGVAGIGNSTFSTCLSLTSVTLANGLIHIWEGAFDRCTALAFLTIPSSVTHIENNAFAFCESLTSLTIPSSVIFIGYYAFSECDSLTGINVNASNPNYASVDGVLYDKDITTLIKCPGGKAGELIIPESVTFIRDGAVSVCASLTSVIIPESVTSIEGWTFEYCTSLASITIPNGVTTIGYSAFNGCSSLATVTLGSSVSFINDTAFYFCTALTAITIPSGVQTIGNAFLSCSSLASIRFLGLEAPTTVSDFWIAGTSAALRGHAYAASNFPAPGYDFHGLTMGDVIPAIGSPGIPLELTATGSDSHIILTWIAPADGGGSAITHYTVYRSVAGSGIYSLIASPSGLGYDDANLTNGQTYSYRVSATNAEGEGEQTAPVSSIPFTVPDAPTGLQATPGDAQVSLTWIEASYDGGRAVDYYIIYLDGVALPDNPNWTTAIVTGLINGQSYSFTVAAHNLAGSGNQSLAASETPFSVPNAPIGLTSTADNSQVSLNWTTPDSDGGRAIDYYVLYQDGVALSDHFAGVTAVITGLSNGQSYSFTVAAHNVVGLGTQSDAASDVPFTHPDAPIGLTSTPGNAHVNLNWTAPAFDGGRPIDYYILYRNDIVLPEHLTGITAIITGLINGEIYNFTIAAHNGAGNSSLSSSASVVPCTVPNALTLGQAVNGSSYVNLTWNSNGNGGSAVTGYRLYRSNTSDGEFVLMASPSVSSYHDAGLSAGHTYWYKVSAVNAVGEGAKSSAVSAMVHLPSATDDNTMLIMVAAAIAIGAAALVAGFFVIRKGKK